MSHHAKSPDIQWTAAYYRHVNFTSMNQSTPARLSKYLRLRCNPSKKRLMSVTIHSVVLPRFGLTQLSSALAALAGMHSQSQAKPLIHRLACADFA